MCDFVNKKESKFKINNERVTSLNDVMIMTRARHEHDVYINIVTITERLNRY